MLNWTTAFHIGCELMMMFINPTYVPEKEDHHIGA